jgi:glyoxylase-like metal-dependent hydrolase (beta-lactamase superfamily II)
VSDDGVSAVVPGVYRLGSRYVNWYLIEDGGRLTVVDAAIPGYWAELEPALAKLGKNLGDVAALLLTHAHSDHTGVAGRLRERGVPVHLHPGDEELMRTGKEPWKREASPLPHLWRPGIWTFFAHMMRNGALKPPKIDDTRPISDGDVLDVPGNPRVFHVPGHTNGHCAFYFERHAALLVGDLLCTWNPLNGRRGPQVMPRAFNVSTDQSLSSLGSIEALAAEAVLPGHGEPWTDGPRAAVERARAAGPS